MRASQYPCGSTFGMGWSRALLKGFICFLNQSRKNLISELIHFILVFYYAPTWSPQNWLNPAPLTSPPGCVSCTIPLCHACVILVGCCVNLTSGGRLRPWHILFYLFFCHLICRPKRRQKPHPYALLQLCLVLITPPTLDTVFWLVVAFFIDWRPRKAWAQPLYLFLNGLLFWHPRQPSVQNRTNRAYPTLPIMWWAGAMRRNGRQTAMGGGRGHGWCCLWLAKFCFKRH